MFVSVSKSYIQFGQKLLVSTTIIFASLTQGRFSTLSSVFFPDEAWRLLPGETPKNSRKKHLSVFCRQNIKKRKFSLARLAYHAR